jgi:RNA polymerase sigma-70 factor (ECF subfamily)
MAFAGEARGLWHLIPTRANGRPAFAAYQREHEGGRYKPFAIQVLTFDVDAKQLREVITFLNPALFPRFNFPLELPA